VKIGLSFDQGDPAYRLYVGALLVAAERANIEIQTFWLAGVERPFDRQMLEFIDGLVLTGGADVEPRRYGFDDRSELCESFPGRDEVELEMLDAAFKRRLPILAICRGAQLLNVHQGGTLIPHLPGHRLEEGGRHSAMIESGSALGLLLGKPVGDVSSSHHQAVDELGLGLQVAARHPDGTIEAIEWIQPTRKPWLAAVQWHPEWMGPDEPFATPLWRGFLQAVAATHSLA
jgi:putative glutamine amidotransferase